MNDKLQLIRQKCIEVNSGIHLKVSPYPNGNIYRTIHVADILLTINESDYRVAIDEQGFFMPLVKEPKTVSQRYYGIKVPRPHWNLRDDDLEQQSEETINFLYELLS